MFKDIKSIEASVQNLAQTGKEEFSKALSEIVQAVVPVDLPLGRFRPLRAG